eukprot:gnl/Spiro4/3652_TR1796_c0_g1_i1.p1 gnl/Spiro4/3652_TR1796_c0_g1~~gnl/Spiro4/3652_TR1796_c0_g1_i1.p1  ORF type:complete len:344 (+),score=-34.10 gnl/Spiro4/3652_TR1796_c0_g1_i1:38-1033(+)
MSIPFPFNDFSKKYNDLSTNNFPTLKKGKLQDTIKFKFSSKAQRGVKLDSSVTNTNSSTTESEFGVKLNFDELKGVEVGYKVKSAPSSELSVKVSDKYIPLENSSFTLKTSAVHPSQQYVSGTFGFNNKHVGLNLGVSIPISRKLYSFINDENNALKEQRIKVDFDFVSRPLKEQDYYLGGEVKTQLPRENQELLYTSKVSLGLINNTTNAGVFVDHKKEHVDNHYVHSTSVGSWAFTEVDDLSGGAKVTYNPSQATQTGNGLEFELVAGLQRDSDSKLSSKVTVVPQTTVSLGYEQNLSRNTKLSFGYAFLLNKNHENSSNYSFGVEISH